MGRPVHQQGRAVPTLVQLHLGRVSDVHRRRIHPVTVGDAAEPGAAAFVETPFLGVRLARLDMQEAARVIAARPFGAPFAYVVTPNAQHFVLLDRGDDQRFSAAYANAWLRLCDSKVVCALARVLLGEHLPHAAGSDLTAYLFDTSFDRKIVSQSSAARRSWRRGCERNSA